VHRLVIAYFLRQGGKIREWICLAVGMRSRYFCSLKQIQNAKEMKEIYKMAAMAAYTNCLELLDEAKILYRHSKFPRAYALAILSAEEFVKSYLCKYSSAGLDPNNEVEKILKDHKKKIRRLIPVLLSAYIFTKCGANIVGAIQHDNRQSHSQQQLAPSVIQESVITAMESQPVTRIFMDAHRLKVKALYADVEDRQLSVPSEVIGVSQCKEVLDFMNECIHGFDLIVKSDDETFQKVIPWLDPLGGNFEQWLEKYRFV
jgi:AbiV family abortive infection protein